MTRAGRGLPTVPVRLPPPGPRASCLEQCSSRTRRGQTNLSCSLDHVTTLIRSDSGAFSLNSHTFLFLESQTHSECGHKRASPGCCGLCGSLLGSAGFPWQRHGEQTHADSCLRRSCATFPGRYSDTPTLPAEGTWKAASS